MSFTPTRTIGLIEYFMMRLTSYNLFQDHFLDHSQYNITDMSLVINQLQIIQSNTVDQKSKDIIKSCIYKCTRTRERLFTTIDHVYKNHILKN